MKTKGRITSKNIDTNKDILNAEDVLIIQAEDNDEGYINNPEIELFQEYVYKKTGKRVPKGVSIGYELRVQGEYKLILCDDIDFLSEA